MDFSFSEEQEALGQVVAELLKTRCTPDDVRAAVDGPGEVAGLAGALDEIGLGALMVPETDGGLGLGVLETCLVLHELGYAGAPGPWIERLLADCPAHEGREKAEDPGFLQQLRLSVGAAAVLTGLARRMLDLAIGHVKVREQFGKPVGSFQAVQHHLADARLAIEFAIPLVWRAAWALDDGLDGPVDGGDGVDEAAVAVWMAKHHSNEAALKSARKALQCHGAMGYAHEGDLQLFMKQVWTLAPRFGDSAACRRKIAASMDL